MKARAMPISTAVETIEVTATVRGLPRHARSGKVTWVDVEPDSGTKHARLDLTAFERAQDAKDYLSDLALGDRVRARGHLEEDTFNGRHGWRLIVDEVGNIDDAMPTESKDEQCPKPECPYPMSMHGDGSKFPKIDKRCWDRGECSIYF